MKHTPGPWVKDYGQTKGHIKTLCNPEVHTKTVIKYRYDLCEEILTEEEIEANARLISCAPEMLDCLIDGMKHNIEHGCLKKCSYTFRSPFCDKCNKMKSILVIEKATGLTIEEVLKNV